MEFDVELYCRLCETCQLTLKRGHHKEPMQHLDAGAPWEVLRHRLIGPLPRTHHGHTAILTMVDHFSRLVVLVPIKRMTAKETVDAYIEKWIAYYGIPRCLHSDQGRHFENSLMYLLLSRLAIRKTRTTAYRPQADGRVERANRTIKQCYYETNARHWSQLGRLTTIRPNGDEFDDTRNDRLFAVLSSTRQRNAIAPRLGLLAARQRTTIRTTNMSTRCATEWTQPFRGRAPSEMATSHVRNAYTTRAPNRSTFMSATKSTSPSTRMRRMNM